MVDYQYGRFYGFANAGLVLPMASAGSILGFSLGLGGSWPIGRLQRLHLDLFGYIAPASVDSNGRNGCTDFCTFVGVGVGIGMHYLALWFHAGVEGSGARLRVGAAR